jgi:hypothetical protein
MIKVRIENFLAIVLICFIVSCSKNNVPSPSPSVSTSCIKISLTSPVGTDSQTVGISIPIKPITYKISNELNPDTSNLSAISVGILGSLPGITSSFSGDVLTLSGSPSTAAGSPFVYEVVATGNVCDVPVKGVVIVKTCGTIQLTSGLGSIVQQLTVHTPIAPITYTVGGGATGVIAANLPPGVTGTYSNGIYEISGKPDSAGHYQYTITTTGGYCTSTDTGFITALTDCIALTLTSDSSTTFQKLPVGQNITPITYRVNVPGATQYEIFGLEGSGLTSTINNGIITISGTLQQPVHADYVDGTLVLSLPAGFNCNGISQTFEILIR